jgi:hypothetical protein
MNSLRDAFVISEIASEWQKICDDVLKKFGKWEKNINWEPRVATIGEKLLRKHIKRLITAEQFTIKILSAVFTEDMENIILNEEIRICSKPNPLWNQLKLTLKFGTG